MANAAKRRAARAEEYRVWNEREILLTRLAYESAQAYAENVRKPVIAKDKVPDALDPVALARVLNKGKR